MTKVISLSNEAYGRLKSLKGERSFSKLVIDLIEPKRNIMDFFGVLKNRADEWKSIEKGIYEDRKKFKLRGAAF